MQTIPGARRPHAVVLSGHHFRQADALISVAPRKPLRAAPAAAAARPSSGKRRYQVSRAILDDTSAPMSAEDNSSWAAELAETFRRDGYATIPNAVTPEQLQLLRSAAEQEIAQILEADPDRQGNRNQDTGGRRYSIGSIQQFPQREWAQLIDFLLPTVGPLLDEIFTSQDYRVVGAGGDFSLPGARIQQLHSDLFAVPGLPDPQFTGPGEVSINQVPVPFVCVNIPLVDFTPRNGPTRQIPGTHTSMERIPGLEDEPGWMRESIVCVKAGSALVRDVRAWHGGTPNLLSNPPPPDALESEAMSSRAGFARPMLNVELTAPWFRMGSREFPMLPVEWWDSLSPRAQQLTRHIVFHGNPEERHRDALLHDREL